MSDPIVTPMLIGAGVGALGGLVTGKNPLKTAALGAAVGGGGAAAGAWGGGQAAASGAPLAGATEASLMPTTLAPVTTLESVSPTFGYTASGLSPYATAAESAAMPTAADIGAGFGADNIASMAAQDPTLWEKLKPYASVQNLSGAANIYDKFNQQPKMIQAPAGGMSRGQAPQGTDVMGLISSIKPKERKRISLL